MEQPLVEHPKSGSFFRWIDSFALVPALLTPLVSLQSWLLLLVGSGNSENSVCKSPFKNPQFLRYFFQFFPENLIFSEVYRLI